jgi:hypothetical protein
MKSFLKFYEKIRDQHGFKIEIYNSSIMEWCIDIGYKVTMENKEYKVISVQSSDLDLAFAMAQVELKKWLLEKKGGY